MKQLNTYFQNSLPIDENENDYIAKGQIISKFIESAIPSEKTLRDTFIDFGFQHAIKLTNN